jgi:predicted enzyme related to lactoylglutathione lyase
VYFEVADVDAALARVPALGGTIVEPAQDTPYGRLARVADRTGAPFRLVTSP